MSNLFSALQPNVASPSHPETDRVGDFPDTQKGDRTQMSDRKSDLEAVRVLMSALEPFRAHNPTMPLQLAFTFLMVAADEGQPVSEYARKLGMAPGVMARNLLDLGDYNRRREPGLELVSDKFDPLDRRIHRKFLTHKGQALVGAISRAMERMKRT